MIIAHPILSITEVEALMKYGRVYIPGWRRRFCVEAHSSVGARKRKRSKGRKS